MAIKMSKGGKNESIWSKALNERMSRDEDVLKNAENLHKRIMALLDIARKSEGTLRNDYASEIEEYYKLMHDLVLNISIKIQSGEIAISNQEYVKITKLYEEVVKGRHRFKNPENDTSIDISALEKAKKIYKEIISLLDGGSITEFDMKLINDKIATLERHVSYTKERKQKKELYISEEDFSKMEEILDLVRSRMYDIEIKFMLDSDPKGVKEKRETMTNLSDNHAGKDREFVDYFQTAEDWFNL